MIKNLKCLSVLYITFTVGCGYHLNINPNDADTDQPRLALKSTQPTEQERPTELRVITAGNNRYNIVSNVHIKMECGVNYTTICGGNTNSEGIFIVPKQMVWPDSPIIMEFSKDGYKTTRIRFDEHLRPSNGYACRDINHRHILNIRIWQKNPSLGEWPLKKGT